MVGEQGNTYISPATSEQQGSNNASKNKEDGKRYRARERGMVPSLTAAARSRRCMLQGLPSYHIDATPTYDTAQKHFSSMLYDKRNLLLAFSIAARSRAHSD